jgi:hypothetical protein
MHSVLADKNEKLCNFTIDTEFVPQVGIILSYESRGLEVFKNVRHEYILLDKKFLKNVIR